MRNDIPKCNTNRLSFEAMTKRHQKLVEHLRSAAEETTKKDEDVVNYVMRVDSGN